MKTNETDLIESVKEYIDEHINQYTQHCEVLSVIDCNSTILVDLKPHSERKKTFLSGFFDRLTNAERHRIDLISVKYTRAKGVHAVVTIPARVLK